MTGYQKNRWRAIQSSRARRLRSHDRAQAAIWEREMLEAIRTDKGVDDLTLVLESRFVQRRGDIVTARDVAYERWPL